MWPYNWFRCMSVYETFFWNSSWRSTSYNTSSHKRKEGSYWKVM